MDRTLAVIDVAESTSRRLGGSPGGGQLGFDRVSHGNQVTKRARSLYGQPFHLRCRELHKAMGEVEAAARTKGDEKTTQMLQLEVTSCVRDFQTRLKAMEVEIAGGGSGRGGEAPNADVKAHRMGALLILFDHLQRLGEAQQDLLNGEGDAGAAPMIWQRRSVPKRAAESAATSFPAALAPPPPSRGLIAPEPGGSPMAVALEDNNRALLAELQQTSASVTNIESSLVEIAQLNSLFSSQIKDQAEKLELLHAEAIGATRNLRRGNKELGRALELNKAGGRIILYCVLAATLALLFLDWISS